MKKFLLAASAAISLLGPSAALAQAYTPTANDTMYISDRTNTRHTVNAKDYVSTQTGGAAALGANNAWTGTNTFSNAVTASPASHNVTLSPTGTGQVIINPATASTIDNEAIGGGTPLAGAFTTLNAATSLSLNGNLALSPTAPTIANGGGLGTVGTIVGSAAAFDVTAGTGAASVFVITLPTATHGWVCNGADVTTHSTAVASVQQTVGTNNTTTVTMGAYSDIAGLAAVGTADHLRISCMAY